MFKPADTFYNTWEFILNGGSEMSIKIKYGKKLAVIFKTSVA